MTDRGREYNTPRVQTGKNSLEFEHEGKNPQIVRSFSAGPCSSTRGFDRSLAGSVFALIDPLL